MTILYFTATGNSLYIAKQFNCKTVSIPQAIKANEYDFSDTVIGVVCSVYCNKPPKIVLKFLAKANLTAEYKFMILTYGHANFGAIGLAAEILKEQNFNYIQTVLMADNYLPVFNMNVEAAIDKKIGEQLEKIISEIGNRTMNVTKRKLGDKIKCKFIDKYFSAHPELNDGSAITVTDKCTGCGVCVKVCNARYRNQQVTLSEIINSNNVT